MHVQACTLHPKTKCKSATIIHFPCRYTGYTKFHLIKMVSYWTIFYLRTFSKFKFLQNDTLQVEDNILSNNLTCHRYSVAQPVILDTSVQMSMIFTRIFLSIANLIFCWILTLNYYSMLYSQRRAFEKIVLLISPVQWFWIRFQWKKNLLQI